MLILSVLFVFGVIVGSFCVITYMMIENYKEEINENINH